MQTNNRLREALETLVDLVEAWEDHLPSAIREEEVSPALDKAKAALDEPPRNCDMPLVLGGPADSNADKAWLVFKQHNPDAYFDNFGLLRCIDWLLAPATEQGQVKPKEVGDDFRPTGWCVYVVEDKTLGFFAGFTNKGAPGDVPIFCDTVDGAVKYDAFSNRSARQLAEAIRNRYVPNGKVLAYKRHEIFPEHEGGETKMKHFDIDEFEKSLENYHTGWNDIDDPIAEIRRLRGENENKDFEPEKEGGAE